MLLWCWNKVVTHTSILVWEFDCICEFIMDIETQFLSMSQHTFLYLISTPSVSFSVCTFQRSAASIVMSKCFAVLAIPLMEIIIEICYIVLLVIFHLVDFVSFSFICFFRPLGRCIVFCDLVVAPNCHCCSITSKRGGSCAFSQRQIALYSTYNIGPYMLCIA